MLKLITLSLFIAILPFQVISAKEISAKDSVKINIMTEMDSIINESDDNSNLRKLNILWPEDSIIRQKKFDIYRDKKLLLKTKINIVPWLNLIIKGNLFSSDCIFVLENMKNGDDWIIGNSYKNEKYYQYINSRTLTLFFEIDVDIKDSLFFEENVVNEIIKNLKNENSNPEFIYKKKDGILEGYFIPTWWKEKIPDTIPKPYFWSNGRYVIIDIFKIKPPVFYKFGYAGKVNSLLPDDERKFKVFNNPEIINYREEAIKYFPWSVDSTIALRERMNSSGVIGGQPQVYKPQETKLDSTEKENR